MGFTQKIKSILALSNKEYKDLADYLGISKQALSNKFYRGSFSAADLVKIAAFCDVELSFLTADNVKITLTENDIKQKD